MRAVRYLYPCAAVASQVVQGTISAPLSGIMGMAFSTIASSRATPFWETLVNDQGTLDEPLMAFQLTRFIDTQGAQGLEPGGTFTLGATNSSLFTGNIDFQSIPDGQEGFWIQELAGMLRIPMVSGASYLTRPFARTHREWEHCQPGVGVCFLCCH